MYAPRRAQILLAALSILIAGASPLVAQTQISVVSVDNQNRPIVDGESDSPSTSFDGRFVAFVSNASNIVAETGLAEFDVFVRDRELRTTERITVAADGGDQNRDCNIPPQPTGDDGSCLKPAISADGRFVAFASRASNLVSDESPGNAFIDVFLRDRTTGETTRISVGEGEDANGNSLNPAISGDGGIVVFQSQATNLVAAAGQAAGESPFSDIFVYERGSGTIRRITSGNGASITPAISADGRVIAFISSATNLIDNDTNVPDVFIHELTGSEFVRASVRSDGEPANAISYFPALSSDGTIVAFKSEASNLVANDSNGVPDVFVRDLAEGTTGRFSVDDFGNQTMSLSGPPSISADACHLAFPSAASNLVGEDDKNGRMDLFVVDRCRRLEGDCTLAEPCTSRIGDDASNNHTGPNGSVPDAPPSMSLNGQWISFASTATDLVPGLAINMDHDVFISGNPLNPPPTEPTPTPTQTPTETPDGFCDDNEDCPPGQVCDPETNRCVTPSPTPTPDGFCDDNEDCPPGQVCDPETNQCVTPSPTPTPVGFCDDNDDCPPGQVCDPNTNMCVTPSPTPTPVGFCDDNDDCPPGQVCDPETNRCVTPSPTPTPDGFCDDNDDCPPGQVCDPNTNMCVSPTPSPSPTPDGFCEDNDDCPPGQVCDPNTNMCVPSDDGGDGGGCSCEIHPSARRENPVEPFAVLLPALVLWLRRRALRRR